MVEAAEFHRCAVVPTQGRSSSYLMNISHLVRSSATMGCVSSRIMTKSASYRDEYLSRYSFKRKGDDGLVHEIVVSQNSSVDQFAALLHTANAVARRLKEGPLKNEPGANNASSLEHTNSGSSSTKESERIANDTETIDVWDQLLDGPEECPSIAVTPDGSVTVDNGSVGPSRSSFRTVEDFDAMLAANGPPPEAAESSAEAEAGNVKCEVVKLEVEHTNLTQRRGSSAEEPERGSRRKAMAKGLAALDVSTTSFEFSRSGSLREWLSLGGGGGLQACSPGSYVTPKFGGFVSSQGAAVEEEEEDGESAAAAVFDPELVAQFERAMQRLTTEEDCILDKIVEDYGGF